MTAPRVSAIVLAGGRSSRFGRDKLAEPLDGRPLLHHAIAGVAPFVSEILVVAAPGAALSLPDGAVLVHDPTAFEGPLVGLVAGLRVAREPIALVVGGDMPTLVGAVLEALIAGLDDDALDLVVLEQDGRPRPLPMATRRAAALPAADRLVGMEERRLRALFEVLSTRTIPEATWRSLDPDGRTVIDVDVAADLP